MFMILNRVEEDLPGMIATLNWSSLLIDYEEPVVERVWLQLGDYRVCLHCIHPCTTRPLYHPHPWPSIMRVMEGRYQMQVGTKDVVGALIIANAPDVYEMVDPNAWHSVQPLDKPVYTLMITGQPFGNKVEVGVPDRTLGPLSEIRTQEILSKFQTMIGTINKSLE